MRDSSERQLLLFFRSQIVINLGGKKDMLGVGVFDGHSGPEASRFVAAHLWEEVCLRFFLFLRADNT